MFNDLSPTFVTEYYFVKTKYKLRGFGEISCGVPQGSTLEIFVFVFVHDILQVAKSNLYFYVDDSFLYTNIKRLQKLNLKLCKNIFENISD